MTTKEEWDKDWADQKTAAELDPNVQRHVLHHIILNYNVSNIHKGFYEPTGADLEMWVGNISSYNGYTGPRGVKWAKG